jgi:hypothetical protein
MGCYQLIGVWWTNWIRAQSECTHALFWHVIYKCLRTGIRSCRGPYTGGNHIQGTRNSCRR